MQQQTEPVFGPISVVSDPVGPMVFVGDVQPLFEALAQAQAAFGPLTKSHTAKVKMKTGGEYEYRYADLADVVAATRPALAAAGVAVLQVPDVRQTRGETWIWLTTILAVGAARIQTLLVMSCDGATPQSIGSGITYARRYALSSLLGLAPDSDDDGRAASERERNDRPAPAQQSRQQQPNRNDRRQPPPPPKQEPPRSKQVPPELEKATRYLRKHKVDIVGMADEAIVHAWRKHYVGVAREWLEARGIDTSEMSDEAIASQYQQALAAEKAATTQAQPEQQPPPQSNEAA